MGFATNISRSFSARYKMPYEFFIGEAMFRLAYVARNYDPSTGVPFGAYFSKSLNGYLFNLIRDKSRLIRPPRAITNLYLKYRKLEPGLSVDEIAEALSVPVEDVQEMLEFIGTEYSTVNPVPHIDELTYRVYLSEVEEDLVTKDETAARCLLLISRSTKDTIL